MPVLTWNISSCAWMTICGWKPCAKPTMSSPSSPLRAKWIWSARASRAIRGGCAPGCWPSPTEICRRCLTGAMGFYRRQLVLTTKEKPAGRVDDPDLAEKMKAEVEGILRGLLRDCSGWPPTTSNSPKVTAPERIGRQSNGTTTMCTIFWILTGMFA